MTIQDLGSLGELIAAIATVATLVYLASQIRQNTASLRATAYQEATKSANDWSRLFVGHPETAAIFGRGLEDPRSLDRTERAEFEQIIEIIIRNYTTYWTLMQEAGIPLGHEQISRGVAEQYEQTFHHWLGRPQFREWALSHPRWGKSFAAIADERT